MSLLTIIVNLSIDGFVQVVTSVAVTSEVLTLQPPSNIGASQFINPLLSVQS